jgi:hypothetical protein
MYIFIFYNYRIFMSCRIFLRHFPRSGYCWTSTADFWVGTAEPQPQGSEYSGHRWISTRNLPSPMNTIGPQPGTFWAQWAPLDLNLG